MSDLETVIADLKALPANKLEAVAGYIHSLRTTTGPDRQAALDRAFGCLTEEEASTMAEAIEANCERIDASQW